MAIGIAECEAKIIKKESLFVRVTMYEGVPMFAMLDFMKACGYMAASKKATKVASDPSHPGRVRLLNIRSISERGPRSFKMYCFDAVAAKAVLAGISVPTDVRKWLENDVLTYNEVAREPTPVAANADDNTEKEARATETKRDFASPNHALDVLLIEIMNFKKQIMYQA